MGLRDACDVLGIWLKRVGRTISETYMVSQIE